MISKLLKSFVLIVASTGSFGSRSTGGGFATVASAFGGYPASSTSTAVVATSTHVEDEDGSLDEDGILLVSVLALALSMDESLLRMDVPCGVL
jgi:hypothetical protein